MNQPTTQKTGCQTGALPAEIIENTFLIRGDLMTTRGFGQSSLSELGDVIRRAERGIYDNNNGRTAFITGDGEYRVAPSSKALFEALDQAGYKSGGLFVPFSNGEVPADPALSAQWASIRERVKALSEAERKDGLRMTFLAEAAARGITVGVSERGDFWRVDNVRYQGSVGGQIRTTPGPFDNVDNRADRVGYYDTNNGLLSFVDESGGAFLGALNDQNIRILEDHGYQQGAVYVSFSNGERPVEEGDRSRLNQLRGR